MEFMETFPSKQLMYESSYLSTVDVLNSLLPEEEVNIVIIFQHLHKIWRWKKMKLVSISANLRDESLSNIVDEQENS